jgi:hypothetical protein
MQSRFAAVILRPAHDDDQLSEPREPEWVLVEWLSGENKPTTCWISTVPAHISLDDLVRPAKLRWRIERDYEEMKSELGLHHYEGRSWLGFPPPRARCLPQSRSCSPGVSSRGELPLRPERHVDSSIATFRISHARILVNQRTRSPWCGVGQ